MDEDALDKLIVNEDESLDIDLLAKLILPYLRFDKISGEMIFNKEFYSLKELQKFLVYLLGRKVVLIKKLKNDFDEKISSKEIEKEIGIKGATVRKYVSINLKEIVKSEKGKYFIPNYNLYKCQEKLQENGKK